MVWLSAGLAEETCVDDDGVVVEANALAMVPCGTMEVYHVEERSVEQKLVVDLA